MKSGCNNYCLAVCNYYLGFFAAATWGSSDVKIPARDLLFDTASMQQEFTKASVKEALNKAKKRYIEIEDKIPELLSLPCGMLVQFSLFTTMVVVANWGRLQQRILLGEGDMSSVEAIIKVGSWIALNGFTGLVGGIVLQLRYPFILGVIFASTSNLLLFGLISISNYDDICDALVFTGMKIPFGRAVTVLLVWLASYYISSMTLMTYFLDKARADYNEANAEKIIDSKA